MRYLILSCLLFLASCFAQAQTVTSFEGIDDSEVPTPQIDNDPNGAVGTKQYMEWINVFYQAYDKTTFAPVWATPQAGAGPWLNNGLVNCGPVGGDGIINFDRLDSRWVIAFHTNPANDQYYYCVAISNTDDLTSPTLAWYTYEFFLNPILGANSQGETYFPDWPKIGTWADAYYATFDLEDRAQKYLNIGILVCAFDRTNMLQGNTPDPMQCFSYPNPIPLNGTLSLKHSLIPADVEGTTPPPVGRDEYLVSIQNPTNNGKATTTNRINLWAFHVDWVTPTNSTFTNIPLIVPAYTPGCYQAAEVFNTYCVPEKAVNPTNKAHYHVDSVGDRFMPRLSYRNFGTYESFLVSHTVRVGKNTSVQTGIRWYEFRGSGTPAIYQSGTLSPDTSLFRFVPSIAQDQNGNAAAGYSVSNASSHPGIKTAWWNLNTKFAPTELAIQTGAGDEEDTKEWGSYTSMTVDPVDNCTFWYVDEYLPANETGPPPIRNTRIANFKIPTCGSQVSPISFVQVAAATPQTPQSTVVVAYPQAQIQGNMNIIVVGWNDNVAAVQSVTDSLGNTYSLAVGPTTGTGLIQSIYYAPNIHSGTNSVTVTFTQQAVSPDVRILEYSGLDPTSPFDVAAGASGSSSSASSGSATTNFASELIFGADMVFTATEGPGAGFTSRIITSDGDIAEDEIVGATGSYAATAPLTSGGPWVMQEATFKAAGQKARH
jgi:hypothetical protein